MRWIGLSLVFVLVWPALCSQQSLPFAAEGQATQNAPTPAQGEPPAQGVTEQEILIGMSAAFKGASRSLGVELYRGSMAYFMEVNRSGGVHGRKITLKAYDDGYQPDQAVNNTLKLMLEDRVFLLFDYVGTPTVTRVLPLLKKYENLHFLLFFPFTGAQPQREPPYDKLAFNLRASYRQETAGLVDNFLAAGRSRIAVFYQADAYGRSGWVGVREALAQKNEKIVGEATYARGTKYTESLDRQVAILQEVKPDAIISVGAYAACAAFIRDARKAGLNVPIANVSFVGSESMLKLLSETSKEDGRDYTSALVNSQVVPSYENLGMPAVREYRELMDKYNPMPPADLSEADYKPLPYSFVSLEGFLNAKMLVAMLDRLGDHPVRAQIAPTVEGIRDFDLGMGKPVSFGAQRNQGSDAIYYTTVQDGRFVPVRDWKEWFK
ncbi:MAG TPA: ABC transporter substrate-binding protein [Candidatus Binatia bacterium]|nr:ABC transporter substrate-binding protein [Candidatus Binatia bacterium]